MVFAPLTAVLGTAAFPLGRRPALEVPGVDDHAVVLFFPAELQPLGVHHDHRAPEKLYAESSELLPELVKNAETAIAKRR